MPTFDFTSPDGKTYSVDGPEGATSEQAFQMLQQHLGSQEATTPGGVPIGANGVPRVVIGPDQATDAPSLAGDIAKSGGIGLAQGAIGIAGMIPDIAGLAKGAANKFLFDPVFNAISGPQKTASPDQQPPNINSMLGSDNIRKTIEGVTGDFYKPQTTAGEYARTIGEFAPNMLGGLGGVGRKLLTNVLAPSIFSETAGQLTEGTAAEPFARFAGGVAGGVGAAKVGASLAKRPAAVPSADDLLKTGGRQFEAVRTSGATVDSNDAQIIAQGIRGKLLQDGADPEAQKLVFNVLDRLEAKGAAGQPIPYSEIDVLRKNLNNLKLNPDGSIRKFAKDATNDLMGYMAQVLPQNVSGTLKEAIGNYAAGKRSNILQGKANLADLNANSAGSGGNIDNASRQALKQLARPINNDVIPVAKKLGFNDAEIAKLNEAIKGTRGGNAARLVGKLAPTGVVSGGLSGGAGFALSGGNPIGAAALPAVGYLAKAIGDLSTKRAVSALDILVRSRSPLAAQVAASLPQVVAQLPPKSAALLNSLTSFMSSHEASGNHLAAPVAK